MEKTAACPRRDHERHEDATFIISLDCVLERVVRGTAARFAAGASQLILGIVLIVVVVDALAHEVAHAVHARHLRAAQRLDHRLGLAGGRLGCAGRPSSCGTQQLEDMEIRPRPAASPEGWRGPGIPSSSVSGLPLRRRRCGTDNVSGWCCSASSALMGASRPLVS